MASTSSIKDEAMRALEGSLTSTLEQSKSLETKLSVTESELATVRTASAKLSREAQELRAALAERDEQLAQLKLEVAESEAESEESRRRLVALRQAGQAVVWKLGPAVLSAQEACAKPRPLEDNLIPVSTGARPSAPERTHVALTFCATIPPPRPTGDEERNREEQLRANFQAVFDACASRLRARSGHCSSLQRLLPWVGCSGRLASSTAPDPTILLRLSSDYPPPTTRCAGTHARWQSWKSRPRWSSCSGR